MRPALQRLLSRPFSFDLLRYLTCTPPPGALEHFHSPLRLCQQYRRASQAAATSNAADEESSNFSKHPIHNARFDAEKATPTEGQPSNDTPRGIPISKTIRRVLSEDDIGRKRDFSQMTFSELEFESDLKGPNPTGRKRLVHQVEYQDDLKLWAQLLEHRRRVHGIRGVEVIWDIMKIKVLQQQGPQWRMGDLFWDSFIDLALTNGRVLGEVVKYALTKCTEPHPTLYVRVIQHFAMLRNEGEVRRWHSRLISQHPPSPKRFRQMVRFFVKGNGDLNILKFIYESNDIGSLYTKVVPVLCAQKRFKEALDWHYVFLRHRDLPLNSMAVEPLMRHLETYFPKKAIPFSQSLLDAEVEFLSHDPAPSTAPRKMSAEDSGMKDIKYDDNLGARWFATKWISLDFAINSIYAIGAREIGPLSLQALAFREPTAPQVSARISQLKDLGISIGNSKYSKAIDQFSRKGMHSLFQSLLESDQHPDALEDLKLQESLLGRYAAAGDWVQYARTRAICLLETQDTEGGKLNLLLRDHLIRPTVSMEGITSILEEMRARGLPVEPRTSRYLLRRMLRPRQKGRRPIYLRQNPYDIEKIVSIFKEFLKSGSWIPEKFWTEIIKRFGMTGRLKDLESLCLFLADWYHPQSLSRRRNTLSLSHKSEFIRDFEATTALDRWHAKHPYSLLFPASLQTAIVEWSFSHYFRQFNAGKSSVTSLTPTHHTPVPAIRTLNEHGNHPITQGITLLYLLRDRGVHIHRLAVRSAILKRLFALYGYGSSNKWHNRISRVQNPFGFTQMVDEILRVWSKGGYVKGAPKKGLFRKTEMRLLRTWVWRLSVSRSMAKGRRAVKVRERRVMRMVKMREEMRRSLLYGNF